LLKRENIHPWKGSSGRVRLRHSTSRFKGYIDYMQHADLQDT